LRIHTREVGEGHLVLLINGIGAHVGMWRNVERSLPGLKVISFDPREQADPRPHSSR
jgi:hypothetical protein